MSDVAIPHDMEPHPLTGMYNGKFGIWLFLASEVMLFGALFSTYVLLRVGAPEGTWPMYGQEITTGNQILNVSLAFVNTLVLITSSVTMVLSWAALKMNNFAKGRMFLFITFALAGVFLVIKFFEYKGKFTHHQVVLKEPLGVDGEKVITSKTDKGERKIAVVNGHAENFGTWEEDGYLLIHSDPTESHDHSHELKIEADKIKRATRWGPNASTFLATYFTLTGLHGIHVIGGMVVILYFVLTGASDWKKRPEKYINRIECTGLYWHFVDLVWIFLFPVLYLL
ncbi:MAG: cytochrome c oxidase subunit 3 [Phycisphaerales bacterium]|nr:cytochrome c oxidase subunit 3 [Phycisphaerales bacterium]